MKVLNQKPEVLNLNEAARFLGTSQQTLIKAVAEGKVPCKRLGKRYFFLVDALRSWLMER